MALPLLKLIDMTGPLGFPEAVVLLQVLQQGGGGRRRLAGCQWHEMTNSSETCLCSTIKHSSHLKIRYSLELS